MKISALLAFLVIACGSQSFAQDQGLAQELLGRWRSTETSKGGIGSMLVFRPDGTVVFSIGAVVEMPYRIEGDELVLPSATTDGPEQRGKLNFSGQNQLNLMGQEQLTRKGTALDSKKLIVGEWEGKREMGGKQLEVHYLFHPNGRCLLLIPFVMMPGKYQVQGSTLNMKLPEQPPVDEKFQIRDGVLTIASESRGANRYSRY